MQSPRYAGKRDVAEQLQPQQQQAKRSRGSPIKTGLAIEPETPETGGLAPCCTQQLPLVPTACFAPGAGRRIAAAAVEGGCLTALE